LRRAYENGQDRDAREDMSLTSLFGGLALANAGLGAVHGFAGPLGGMFHAPHGAVCASLLPWAIEVNVKVLKERAADSPSLKRYNEIGQILTGNPAATASDTVRWVQELCQVLNVPSLSAYGLTQKDVPVLVEKAGRASSMKANPIKLAPEEMTEIISMAL